MYQIFAQWELYKGQFELNIIIVAQWYGAKLNLHDNFQHKSPHSVPNLIEIQSVVSEMKYADGQTDPTVIHSFYAHCAKNT